MHHDITVYRPTNLNVNGIHFSPEHVQWCALSWHIVSYSNSASAAAADTPGITASISLKCLCLTQTSAVRDLGYTLTNVIFTTQNWINALQLSGTYYYYIPQLHQRTIILQFHHFPWLFTELIKFHGFISPFPWLLHDRLQSCRVVDEPVSKFMRIRLYTFVIRYYEGTALGIVMSIL